MNEKYIGFKGKSKRYDDFTVINYLGGGWYTVEFSNGYKVKSKTKEICSGGIKNPTYPSVHGVGFVGTGLYTAKSDEGGHSKAYEVWSGMLRRCYSKDCARFSLYGGNGITVCGDWFNFQVFAEWYYSQPQWELGYDLDKDLLDGRGVKYSPETCTLVPSHINSLFTGGRKEGVTYNKSKGKWVVQLQQGEVSATGRKKQTYYGAFEDKKEALSLALKAKLCHVSEVVNKYRDTLDSRVFSNLTTEEFVYGLLKGE